MVNIDDAIKKKENNKNLANPDAKSLVFIVTRLGFLVAIAVVIYFVYKRFVIAKNY